MNKVIACPQAGILPTWLPLSIQAEMPVGPVVRHIAEAFVCRTPVVFNLTDPSPKPGIEIRNDPEPGSHQHIVSCGLWTINFDALPDGRAILELDNQSNLVKAGLGFGDMKACRQAGQ
jgi:hypothetical protein